MTNENGAVKAVIAERDGTKSATPIEQRGLKEQAEHAPSLEALNAIKEKFATYAKASDKTKRRFNRVCELRAKQLARGTPAK